MAEQQLMIKDLKEEDVRLLLQFAAKHHMASWYSSDDDVTYEQIQRIYSVIDNEKVRSIG